MSTLASTSKPSGLWAKLFVVHNIVTVFVIHNVIHNTKLWPFVVHNCLKKEINSFKTAQNYIMNDILNDINDKRAFPLHEQSWRNSFAKNQMDSGPIQTSTLSLTPRLGVNKAKNTEQREAGYLILFIPWEVKYLLTDRSFIRGRQNVGILMRDSWWKKLIVSRVNWFYVAWLGYTHCSLETTRVFITGREPLSECIKV